MGRQKKLVIGASGFTGSHVTRQLVERGDDVRVMVRPTSSTAALRDLDVEYAFGDVFNRRALRRAMSGCDDVYYCVVDARVWLRDPSPLRRTNVDGLQTVLDVAVESGLRKFVFLSTIGTLAISDSRPVTEEDPFNWPGLGGEYIATRVAAEDMVLRYAREKGLPAVVTNVSITFGPRDWAPTPHGAMLHDVATGRMPFYIDGAGWEVIGIEDAARGMLLAAEHGRVGERYILSERFASSRELLACAAEAGGRKAPRLSIPLRAMYRAGRIGDVASKVLRRDMVLSTLAVRLMHIMTPLDHSKAERELGWRPNPIEDSIRGAVQFYLARAGAVAARNPRR